MDYEIILYIVGIAILFLLVQRNNKNNQRRFYDRKGRNFRENYRAKKDAAKEKRNIEKPED